jgi:hypothetical protein
MIGRDETSIDIRELSAGLYFIRIAGTVMRFQKIN